MQQMSGNPSLSLEGLGVALHKVWVLKTKNVCRRFAMMANVLGISSSTGAGCISKEGNK